MEPEALGIVLARINAGLNLTSGVFLVSGWIFIKRHDKNKHRLCMLGAVAASVLFLAFYLTRFSITGTHRFAGEGAVRVAYLVLLFSHMTLAALIVPGIVRLLYLVRKERFQDHARLARWVHPAWLYVSLTGLVVYAMLYHVYGYL